MKRPLQAYEPIKPFSARNKTTTDSVFLLDKGIEINASCNVTFDIEVESEGVYLCQALMSYDRDSLAQSSCSMAINGQFSMSFAINGTEGKSILVEGLKVSLRKGIYTISLDFVKAGAKVEVLSFTRE